MSPLPPVSASFLLLLICTPPAVIQLRAHGAVPIEPELRGAVLEPDHLVRGRQQRVPRHHPQGAFSHVAASKVIGVDLSLFLTRVKT